MMTQDKEHFYAVQSFLEDDELDKIWNIIEIAMEREGYDVQNAELSMRLYDQEEERICEELEEKLYNAQENDLLRTFTTMGGLN